MSTWDDEERVRARKQAFEAEGLLWRHNGDLRRPYVRLNSGLISNGYFNSSVLTERPTLLASITAELVWEYLQKRSVHPSRVIGPAMGAITFAHEVAKSITYGLDGHKEVRTSFAEKDGTSFVFKRNPPLDNDVVLYVEDTITTGNTICKVHEEASRRAKDLLVEKYVLALCNRSGEEIKHGFGIISYITVSFTSWEEESNPFTGGKEQVPPIERVKENWHRLIKD